MILLAARALAATCEEGLTTNEDRYEAWRCFYMEARKAGTWADAEARLTAGAATDPWAEISLGHVYSDQGDARAERHYRNAIAAFATRSERIGAAQARFGLANYLWHSGAGAEPPQAELELALADALAVGEPRLLATARAQQARHLWRTGEDYGRAYSLAKEAEKDAFPDGTYQLRQLVLHVLSGVCDETGRVEEGLAFKARMVDLASAKGDTYLEATARLNTAETWLTAPWLAAPGAALAEAERALDAARRANNPYSEAGARCVMARARGETASAIADWTACAEGYVAIDEQDAALYGRTGLAVAARGADPSAADAAVDTIIRDAERLEAHVRGLDARYVSTELAWERGDTARALERSDALLDALEAARDREVSEADRAGLGAHGAVAYDARASHLVDGGDLDGALATLERLRGRLLLEWLAGAEQADAPPRSQASVETGGQGSPSRPEGTVASQGQAPLDPAVRELLDAPPPSVADLRGLLAPDEAIVVYQLANPQTLFPYDVRSWALVVTPASAEVVPLAHLDGLDSRARLFEGLVLARDGSDAAAAAPLADALLRPVEAVLPASVRRLVLVPDGALHRLPLAALGGPIRATSTVPSLRAWLALRRVPAPAGTGVLAVADPALPRAPAEVRTVVARLGGSVQIGGDTAQSSLRAALQAAPPRVLHLAAHVAVDEAHPERSVVRLGALELHPRDIAGLALDGQLVVLSACAGASGRVVDGEGVLGMARAFLQAGARGVVASVWPIEDREAERIFTRFSDALGEGMTVDDALRVAQEDARASGLPTGAWAGLVVVGDGGWAPFPGGVSRWGAGRWAAVIAGIGVAVAAVWRRLGRR